MNYTLHQLKVYLKVYELKSITRASEQLFLTQPAVSIQLKRLQEQFEIPLTEVIGRRLFITDFGERIAQACYRVLEEAEGINQQINLFKGILTGKIKISTVSTGKYILPYYLKKFMHEFDQVNMNVDVTNKQMVLKALKENSTDLALVSVLPDDFKLKKIKLIENHLFLFASKHCPYLEDFLKTNDLAAAPLIFRENGSATRAAMEEYLNSHNIIPKKTMELVSNEAVKQGVIAGLGFSIMPLVGLENEIKNGDIQILNLPELPIITTWNLVYNAGKSLNPVLESFLNHLEQEKEYIRKKKFSWINAYIKP